jgi:hypothetical protein
MTTSPVALRVTQGSLAFPILAGGFVAGLLDMTSAYVTYGRMMPLGIAGGLIGAAARHPAVGPYLLGLWIHYFIALSAAAVYCIASRKLGFLRDHFFVCGLFYGIAVFLVMNLVVLPLSADHAMGPYTYRGLVQGLLAHMFLIGLPISTSLRMLSR